MAHGFNPTVDELAIFQSLEDTALWAGVDTGSPGSLYNHLGCTLGGAPTSFREVAGIPIQVWVTATNSPPGPGFQPFTALDKSKLGLLRRACLCKVGGDPEEAHPLPSPHFPPHMGRAPPETPRSDHKLSSLVDPRLDTYLVPLDNAVLVRLFADYKATMGMEPGIDIMPSTEQISAVAQMLDLKLIPCVSFGLFGQHGRRALKRPTFRAQAWNPETGTLRKVEMPGPPDFDILRKSWMVFKCTMILLKACKPEPHP
jgi:hypothetical protein